MAAGKQLSRRGEAGHTLILVLTALIWGGAFVSQSMGADYVGTFTFQALRNWLGAAVLIPFIFVMDQINIKRTGKSSKPKTRRQKKFLYTAGVVCGFFLFVASALQQAGIAYTTTAKSGFITALYVVIVPLFSLFRGKRPGLKIWLCVLFSLIGLYFLCLSDGLGQINKGDVLTLLCAVAFSLQILAVSHYIRLVDGVRLSLMQILTTGILSTILMVTIERPSLESILQAAVPILYAGIMSSGIAYTLQIIGQKGLNPTIASIAMCLESVFSALGGWLVLNQTLTMREAAGCGLMFAAIILCEIPISFKKKKSAAESL